MSDGLPPPPPGYGYEQQGYGYSYGPVRGTGEPSGFWRRFAAALLDGLVLAIPQAIVALVVAGGDFALRAGYGFAPDREPIANLINTVIAVLYYALLEGGPRGQTLGKMAVGIRVADANTGGSIGIGRGVGRYFARILSAIPLGLGYFWMLWDPRKQTWHDKLVNSVVVRTQS